MSEDDSPEAEQASSRGYAGLAPARVVAPRAVGPVTPPGTSERTTERQEVPRGSASIATFPRPVAKPGATAPAAPAVVSFDRTELREILDLYGRKVAAGEWRDYAIDCLKDKAVFSVFRRTSEVPLYRIEKDPKLARRQGAYSVVTASGLILKRGHELARVIAVLERALRVVG
jgi:hypothetical protein